MSRDEGIRVRLTAKELKILKAHAKKLGVAMSEVIRDYIKSLEKK